MLISITTLASLARARTYVPGFSNCVALEGTNGSTAWPKSVVHPDTMRTAPGSLREIT